MTRRPRRSQVELAAEAEAKLRKEQARVQLQALKLRGDRLKHSRKMLSVSRAAEVNRFTNDWIAPDTSADSATIPDLMRTNARARQVVRDDPWAKSIVRCFVRNVPGKGITPSIEGRPFHEDYQRWANTPALVDMEGRRTFGQIQQWAESEVATVGECFVVRWILSDPLLGHALVLQCYEFEQLDRYKISHVGPDGVTRDVRHGIEVDEKGKAVAYHFYVNHPNDIRGLGRPSPLSLESIRIPANIVSHVYDPERCRQTHGRSRLAPVLRKLRDLSEYDAAQLRAARAEASIGLIIRGGDDSTDPLQLDGLNVAYLEGDEEVTPFTPSRPGNTYDPFTRAQLSAIAAGVGTSYDQIARNFDQGSYSSKRQTSIEDQREWSTSRDTRISQLCVPVLESFEFVWSLQNPSLAGDYFLRPYPLPTNWQGDGWDWVDPEQQGKGVERKLRMGLTTRTRELSRLGTTPGEIDKEAARDGTAEIVARLDGDGREVPAADAAVPTQTQEVASASV